MPSLKIDGVEYEFEQGMSLIQVCDQHGVEIPRFCYHEKLEIAGNCRMCLVEVTPGPPKPQASCALPAMDGQEVKTKSPMVKKAREGVMEFLLANHPLDCPICDQGGECDLQDQALYYGSGKSRFDEEKRSVAPKEMGPLIKPHMTRCIHCTRCVRFAEDIAGVPELGAIGRGEHTEITTLGQAVHSELSANVIDLCPVGALTSKPYAFVARPWELKKTESIDVMDALGSNIRIDSRGDAVLRVLPRLNDAVNEEWISDKSRYACDGLRNQRLDRPYVRKDGKLEAVGWDEALQVIAERVEGLAGEKIATIVGNDVECESIFALKQLMTQLKSPNLECRQGGSKIDASDRASYLFNSTIEAIDEADFCLLVGTNPRWEAPVLNARLRKAHVRHGLQVANIGEAIDLTYPVEQLGNDPRILNKIYTGEHEIAEKLKSAKKPLIIVGAAALAREDGASVLSAVKAVAEQCNAVRDDWNGFNMLHHAAARVGALDLGFVPQKGGKDMAGIVEAIDAGEIEFVYLHNVDEIDMSYLGKAFVVYQGHHGDIGAQRADVILPGSAYTEKDGIYVNTEGRVQEGFKAVFAPGLAKEDWKIIRALSELVGKALPYNTIQELRAEMFKVAPWSAGVDEITPSEWKASGKLPKSFRIKKDGFVPVIRNFYMTDPISRASATMAECTRAILKQGTKALTSKKEAA